MDKSNEALAVGGIRPSWIEFCEKHARMAAEEFLESFLVFLKNFPATEIRPREPIDFARKFAEFFLTHFEKKLRRRSSDSEKIFNNFGGVGDACMNDSLFESSGHYDSEPSQNGFSTGTHHFGQTVFRTVSVVEEEQNHEQSSVHDESDHEHASVTSEQPSALNHPLNKHKGSILKRFSFRKMKKKGLFKQNSDEVELAVNSSDNYSKDKQDERKTQKRNKQIKLSKHKHTAQHPSGEIMKEGIVHVLTGEDSKGKSRWEKTRLVLVKLNGSCNLEFYSPPKVIILKTKKAVASQTGLYG